MKRLTTAAFSLIEVVLALGIAAFTLTAILGLCSVGLSSNKASTDDTVLSAIATEVMGELRAESFFEDQSNIYLLHGRTEKAEVVAGTAPAAIALDERFYDPSGVRLMKSVGATVQDITENDPEFKHAAYRCKVTLQGESATSGIPKSGIQDINLLLVKLEFRGAAPAQSPTNSPRVFHATIARNN